MGVDVALCEQWSRQVFDFLLGWSFYREAQTIMTYMAVRNEVDTFPIARHILAQGKRLTVPLIDPTDHSMIASHVLDIEKELVPRHFNLWEPTDEYTRPVPIEEIDLYLVPAVVWNRCGIRLGYGGGYYDRYLMYRAPWSHVLGLAYEFQLDDTIPSDPWDVPVEMLLTEKRLLDCRLETIPPTPLNQK